MNPNPNQIAWIRSFVATLPDGWETPDAAIVEAANAATVPNPNSQPTVAKPFTAADLIGNLDPAAIARLRSFPSLPRVLDDVAKNDVAGCNLWLTMLLVAQDVNQAQHDAMAAVVNATWGDPSWRPQVGAAEAAIGRPLDQHDTLAARP